MHQHRGQRPPWVAKYLKTIHGYLCRLWHNGLAGTNYTLYKLIRHKKHAKQITHFNCLTQTSKVIPKKDLLNAGRRPAEAISSNVSRTLTYKCKHIQLLYHHLQHFQDNILFAECNCNCSSLLYCNLRAKVFTLKILTKPVWPNEPHR